MEKHQLSPPGHPNAGRIRTTQVSVNLGQQGKPGWMDQLGWENVGTRWAATMVINGRRTPLNGLKT